MRQILEGYSLLGEETPRLEDGQLMLLNVVARHSETTCDTTHESSMSERRSCGCLYS